MASPETVYKIMAGAMIAGSAYGAVMIGVVTNHIVKGRKSALRTFDEISGLDIESMDRETLISRYNDLRRSVSYLPKKQKPEGKRLLLRFHEKLGPYIREEVLENIAEAEFSPLSGLEKLSSTYDQTYHRYLTRS